jgi:hypothetical protein
MKKEWQDILDDVEFLYREAKDQANTVWFSKPNGLTSQHNF